MTTTTTTKPASQKQLDLITKLFDEKLLTADDVAWASQEYGDYRTNVKTASGLITWLFGRPRKQPASGTTKFAPDAGVYLAGDTIYRVRIAKSSGQWYAEKCVKPEPDSGRKSLSWDYVGKRVDLSGATVMDDAEAGRYLNYCIRCGAELTDPDSIARGMGPICANK